MDRTIRSLLTILLTLVLTAQATNTSLTALAAQTEPPTDTVLVPGTVTLPDDLAAALKDALAQAHASGTLTPLPYYAPSALDEESNWFFVSLVGLSQLDAGQTWNLERADWIGLVLLHQDTAGRWQGAVEGTAAFSALLAAIPDAVVPARAKAGLDPDKRRQLAATETYRFPWEPGTRMQYGVLGIHNGGFATVVGNYKAVDFLSDANTSAGHAPNRLLAAASGTVTYRCYDGYSAAVRIGDLLYVHLLDNPNLVNNHYFNQGDELGQLKTGNFNFNCGYGSQGPSTFHVHWAFPDTGIFQAGGWTLDWRNVPADQLTNVAWQRGTETRGPLQWFLADPITPPAPVGWHVEYFNEKTLTTRCYDTYEDTLHLSKQWGTSSPVAGCPPDDFSARFTRTVNFAAGCYRFTARADDGLRLWVDNRLIFDQWWEQDATMQADLYLDAGAVPLKAEYYERGWGAMLALAWQQLPDEACASVGPDLRPYTPAGRNGPIVPSSVRGTNVPGALVAGQPAYFDWYFVNDGLSSISNDFSVELWIDGERRAESTFTSIEPGITGSVIDWAATLVTPGWHTVKLVIDPANVVPELNETNNTWISTFYWQ